MIGRFSISGVVSMPAGFSMSRTRFFNLNGLFSMDRAFFNIRGGFNIRVVLTLKDTVGFLMSTGGFRWFSTSGCFQCLQGFSISTAPRPG